MVGYDSPFGERLSRREFVKRGGAGLMGAMLLGASGCGGNGTSQGSSANVQGAKTLVKGEGGGDEVVFWTAFTSPADGVLQPLDQYADPAIGDEYIGFAWEEVLYEDKPYALPFDTDVRALYYRRDMLRDAGIDPAEFDAQNGPVTVARLTEIAAAVDETKGTVTPR